MNTAASHAPRMSPDDPGWFAASIADGDGHYGRMDEHGHVTAVCGVEFQAERHPCEPGVVTRWHRPADEQHACPACRAIQPASCDSSHEWQDLVSVQ